MKRRVLSSWQKPAVLAGLILVTFVFWGTWLTWPVQLLVVFVHECGHALAAVLTGGEVRGLTIDAGGLSGRTATRGGFPFLILQSGYLASAIFGAALVTAAARPATARNTLLVLAVTIAGGALAFARPLLGVTLLFALALAALFTWASRKAPDAVVRWGLVYVAAVSALYALLDIREDLLRSGGPARTDATLLAARTGIPAILWGVLWASIAVAMMWTALRRISGRRTT